jgi:hypothetical protein
MKSLFHQFDEPFPLKKFSRLDFSLTQFSWIFKPESGDMVWIPDHLQPNPPIEDPPPPPSNLEARKSTRHRYGRPIEAYPLRPEPSDNPYRVVARDISRSGLCLETSEPFPVGHIFLLKLKVSGKKVVHAPAQVIWAQKKASGLEFLTTEGLEDFFDALVEPTN